MRSVPACGDIARLGHVPRVRVRVPTRPGNGPAMQRRTANGLQMQQDDDIVPSRGALPKLLSLFEIGCSYCASPCEGVALGEPAFVLGLASCAARSAALLRVRTTHLRSGLTWRRSSLHGRTFCAS
jgi:hypothetical protein